MLYSKRCGVLVPGTGKKTGACHQRLYLISSASNAPLVRLERAHVLSSPRQAGRVLRRRANPARDQGPKP